jgi:hypothetical protein
MLEGRELRKGALQLLAGQIQSIILNLLAGVIQSLQEQTDLSKITS